MKCEKCKKREATVKWIEYNTGAYLAFSHGMYSNWCEICAIEAQLKYIKSQIKEIPKLQARLTAITQESKGDGK